MKSYVVIMAGGSGERFWPYSRIKKPKQLLMLTSTTKTMLQEAIDRIEPLVPQQNILIITSEVLKPAIIEAMPNFPAENVIAEPGKRNTAPCLALAASIILQREQMNSQSEQADATMAVLTADHFIGNEENFRTDVKIALMFAEKQDALVTLGIPPSRPETGYGYIHFGNAVEGDIRTVQSFKEKPDVETALLYVRGREYLWNSGMFFWRANALFNAMKECVPEIATALPTLYKSVENEKEAEAFLALPNISIDYAVMERAKNVFVKPATFVWDDVGSWDSLDRLRTLKPGENVEYGLTETVDTESSIIVNTIGDNHIVATLGLRDMVVVATPDATLVCPKDRAQEVKRIVQAMRNKGLDDVL
ncbi:MAG: mannose-1-phosphate guanylyltransferase [Ignavibacteria bacterium]|nr:mannose-1-phosphate guanylyltransferase [Ignavibacteria bacterium]